MSPKELKKLIISDITTKSNEKNKKVLKAGSVHDNVEINEHYLD